MEPTLKNGAKLLGLFLLAISIYLSYDGFDQGVTGGNTSYSNLAKLIGLVIAVSVGTLQFIFSSRYDQLNTTLKGAGLLSYVYSIWTNYLGAKHLLGMDDMTAIATAFFMDVVPEPMIAWSLGDSMKGDVLGNLGKWFTGYQPRPQQQTQQTEKSHQPHREDGGGSSKHKNNDNNHKGGGNRPKEMGRAEQAKQRYSEMPFKERRGQDTRPRQQMGFQGRDLEKNPLTDEELAEKIEKLEYK